MLWTLLSINIILLLVIGMVAAAKLAGKIATSVIERLWVIAAEGQSD